MESNFTEEDFDLWKKEKGVTRITKDTGWYFDKFGNGLADTDSELFKVYKKDRQMEWGRRMNYK